LDRATATGLLAFALAPGALLAPTVVAAAGGRRADMAGALGLGTVGLSIVLTLLWPGANGPALIGAQAFVIASLVAGAVPTLRDRVLVPLAWLGQLAAAAVIALAVGSGPRLDPGALTVAVAAAAVTLAITGALAIVLRRDVLSALVGAGTRDPIVAIALAWSLGGPVATGVPIVNAAILGIAAGALVILRR
jgi:hypothetical protein